MTTPYLAVNRRIIQSTPQMGINVVRPNGFKRVTARWWTGSGGGESLLFVEASHQQDAFAAVREWFKTPAWTGYELTQLSA